MSVLSRPEFTEIDRHFANFIGRFGGDETLVPLAAALLSRSIREGNICLPLDHSSATCRAKPKRPARWSGRAWPEWRSALANSKAVGGPDAQTPLVLDDSDRLYLRRYWDYQQRLAGALREKAAGNRAESRRPGWDSSRSHRRRGEQRADDYLRGPGTGKTTTVLHILARLLQQPENERLRVALAAPTGKAAARLEETIRIGLQKLECPEEVKARMPKTASTIHRLLGFKGNSVYFRHDHAEPASARSAGH